MPYDVPPIAEMENAVRAGCVDYDTIVEHQLHSSHPFKHWS